MLQIFSFGILLYVMALPQLPSHRPFGIPGFWTFSDLNEQINNFLKFPQNGKETVVDIITSYGYPSEVHYVETEDGFILELHRIPHGKSNKNEYEKRPVVFLQHCLLCSSADWIINSPDKSLGYILADRGFDVWIGNARGNTYSRRHKKFSPRNKKFWDFRITLISKQI
ncbi:Gastric triacylglycerol lipase [Armadillidium nasatum]|uniref:Gastric triacylglycerol lipase n=1 Tax=Armadillidium nasatum TaxID=96803 RepID=A0A5N5TK96_9CRUS|nr:Gastric triacylglycerol lipase [Armadillidium nasatum]